MGNGFFQDNAGRTTSFDGHKNPKMGTSKHPAQLRVQTEERRKEVEATCQENKWECEITVDPDQPEMTTDLDTLLNKPKTFVKDTRIGRNDPCVCGSGLKYKKCCGKPS